VVHPADNLLAVYQELESDHSDMISKLDSIERREQQQWLEDVVTP
jgi:hypothetical protein